MRNKRFLALLIMSMPCSLIWAQHELDLLYGYSNNAVAVIQPVPHPVRTMARPQPNTFLQDVGMDFYILPGWQNYMLQSVRVQQTWISPGLVGTKSGVGNVFCATGCSNRFDLPFSGTPHHHFIFSATAPGVYIWDMRAVNGVDDQGRVLSDLPYIYRIYMVANPQGSSLNRIFGSVQAASAYQGDLYGLMLTIQIKTSGTVIAQSHLPCNPAALYAYMVGFTQNGTYDVVAKLSKHLSRKVGAVLMSPGVQLDWSFETLGDVNGDDVIDDSDLLQILFDFGGSYSTSDLNGDGTVDDVDLLIVLFNFGLAGEGRS